jgi:hypothetical protein
MKREERKGVESSSQEGGRNGGSDEGEVKTMIKKKRKGNRNCKMSIRLITLLREITVTVEMAKSKKLYPAPRQVCCGIEVITFQNRTALSPPPLAARRSKEEEIEIVRL